MAKIISYDRRVYESVDDNSLSWAISQNQRKKERMQQRVKYVIMTNAINCVDILN